MRKFKLLNVALLLVLLLLIPRTISGQIKIRLKPFIGLGVSSVRSFNPPVIPIEDLYDQLYYDRNLKDPPGLIVRSIARANLLNIYDISFGYQFWGHKHQYSSDLPDNQFIIGIPYPRSFTYSFHAVTMQWTLNYRRISSKRIVPFILVGYGPYYGSAKDQHYDWINTDETIAEVFVTRKAKWDGYGFLFGAGATVFRFGYFYIGYVQLQDDTLPHHRFIDVTVGVTY